MASSTASPSRRAVSLQMRPIPGEAERLQLRRPRRRHPRAGVAAVQFLLARPLVMDPPAQPRVLGPAPRHVAVAVLLLVRHQPRELRLPDRIVRSRLLCTRGPLTLALTLWCSWFTATKLGSQGA